jgi:hypothetical protein
LASVDQEKKALELDLTFTLASVLPTDGGQPLLLLVGCCHNLFTLSAEETVEINKASINILASLSSHGNT